MKPANPTEALGKDVSARKVLLNRNENPWGPPSSAVKLISQLAFTAHRYPADLHRVCTVAVARAMDLTADQVVLTTGIDEAIDLFLSLGSSLFVFWPGFSGYAERAAVAGVEVAQVSLLHGFCLPDMACRSRHIDLLIINSPHNPTGIAYDPKQIIRLAAECNYLLCDETYIEFSTKPSVLTSGWPENAIVFRSFSKAYALAGLRVGCLVASRRLIARLESKKAFYTVDTISLAGVLGALEESDHLSLTVEAIRSERQKLFNGLLAIPRIRVWDSEANFLLFKGETERLTAQIGRDLEQSGVLVRDCGDFGLPHHWRVSVGTPNENEHFLQSMRRIGDNARNPHRT
jgi:histidinol-phosphate aminotransferase